MSWLLAFLAAWSSGPTLTRTSMIWNPDALIDSVADRDRDGIETSVSPVQR